MIYEFITYRGLAINDKYIIFIDGALFNFLKTLNHFKILKTMLNVRRHSKGIFLQILILYFHIYNKIIEKHWQIKKNNILWDYVCEHQESHRFETITYKNYPTIAEYFTIIAFPNCFCCYGFFIVYNISPWLCILLI